MFTQSLCSLPLAPSALEQVGREQRLQQKPVVAWRACTFWHLASSVLKRRVGSHTASSDAEPLGTPNPRCRDPPGLYLACN